MTSTDKYKRMLNSHYSELLKQINDDVISNKDFTVDDVTEFEHLKRSNCITDVTENQFRTELETMIRNELEPKHYELTFNIDATSYYDDNQAYGPDRKWLVMNAIYNKKSTSKSAEPPKKKRRVTAKLFNKAAKKHKETVELFDEAVAKHNRTLLHIVKMDGLQLRHISDHTGLRMEAVKQNGLALRYITKQSKDICLEAVKQNKDALNFVDDEFVIDCEEYLFDTKNKH